MTPAAVAANGRANGAVTTHRARRLRVMQMTDWLEPGGKERVAVNIANLLPRDRFESFLCTTRRSNGALEQIVQPDVVRLRLQRTRRFDWKAMYELVAFNASQHIDVLHAHGSSLFIASLAAMFRPYPAVVWHDHYGRYKFESRPTWLYRAASRNVDGVIAVNQPLLTWSRTHLAIPEDRAWYVPNFACEPVVTPSTFKVPGVAGRRIACVAHLRPQKDHATLVAAMGKVVKDVPDAHLLLVGGYTTDEEAAYVARLKSQISTLGLDGNVTFLGQRDDVPSILAQCDIGVLSSASEGFPLALIEYGQAGLGTVSTRVGECPEVLDEGRAGLLVSPGDPDTLADALSRFLMWPAQRQTFGETLRRRVRTLYRSGPLMERICGIYETVAAAES